MVLQETLLALEFVMSMFVKVLRSTPRPVAVSHAPMTAFKSASVMLCGRHFTGQKSKWPAVYKTPPFDCIEVRNRDTYFGMQL